MAKEKVNAAQIVRMVLFFIKRRLLPCFFLDDYTFFAKKCQVYLAEFFAL
jgi:hypothetical protein